ncbi:MAG: hypothetical protein KDD22_04685, partial [Bdellovibrionales bacterium]|nr:hypothetical protein [Bdellovibrionales bacterium]
MAAEGGDMRTSATQLSESSAQAAKISGIAAQHCQMTYDSCRKKCEPLLQQAQAANNQAQAQEYQEKIDHCVAIYKQQYGALVQASQGFVKQAGDAGQIAETVGTEPPPEQPPNPEAKEWQKKVGYGAIIGMGILGVGCVLGLFCKNKDKDKDKDKDDGDDTTTPPDDGDDDDVDVVENPDCTLPKYAKHPDCVNDSVDRCEKDPTAEGCDDFTETYCGPYKDPVIAPTAASINGKGIGTVFCDLRNAKEFCKPNTRGVCPTCVNLAKLSSDSCKDNPVMCLPQMSEEDINKAKVVCPIDPLFSNPDFLAGKSTSESAVAYNGNGYNSTTVSASFGKKATAPAAASGSSAKVAGKAATGNTATMTAGWNRPNRGVANTRVAADIAISVGPTLFARQSGSIARRCQSGKINNCGPRSIQRGTATTN